MKSQKSKWLGMLAVAILLTASLSASAQRFRGDQNPPSDHSMEMDKAQRPEHKGPQIPNLTEEQKSQLKEFHLQEIKKVLPIENLVAEKEARLNTLTTSEKYDEKAINRVIEEIGGLKTDLAKLKVASQHQIKRILTEEQLLVFNKHQPKKPKPNRGQRR